MRARLEKWLPRRAELAVKRLLLVLLAFAACHVTPLPVSHPEEWQPGNGATDYPPLSASAPIADAGTDARP